MKQVINSPKKKGTFLDAKGDARGVKLARIKTER